MTANVAGVEILTGFPVGLVVFSVPAVGSVLVSRWRENRWEDAFRRVGWRVPALRYVGWGLVFAAIVSAAAWPLLGFVPPTALRSSDVSTSSYASLTPSITVFAAVLVHEAIYTALGEELLFRGLIAGVSIRRFGFVVGNAIQTAVFLLPHLLLLVVSVSLWPIVLLQLIAGWVLGWLYHRSGSVLPGWVTHSLVNAAGAMALAASM